LAGEIDSPDQDQSHALMESRRRILQISGYPPPRSGWAVRVQYLKEHLQALGHDCVVLNTGVSRRIPSPEYETVLGLGDYIRKVWRYTRAGFLPHVHVNGKSPKGLALALIAELVGRVNGTGTVLTFHAGEQQQYFPKSTAPAWAPLFTLLFRLPAHIICNNEAVKARICEYGIPPAKITPIQAFSRQYLQFERVSLGSALDRFWSRFDCVLFSYLNLRPGYHPETLLEAFERLAARRADVGLVLCGVMGHPDPELSTRVRARLQREALRDRVHVVDDLDHDQFLTALSRAAVFVRTPPEDGVSSSVLEALALRTPVVAAANDSRPPGVVAYPPTDAAALAAVLEDVLARRQDVIDSLPIPVIPDTLTEEAAILVASADLQPTERLSSNR
jgi:glycosyltransferase involved in cell wall biosynthesis